jgi:tRNA A-37 threonylcarbamoyl transferase component Bud32
MLMAKERGLPVPTVYGYAEKRHHSLMVTDTAVMMEDFPSARTMRSVLTETPSPDQRGRALAICGELVLQLYRAGCNHIDLSMGNIMLPVEDHEHGRLIDFMYATFLPSPSINVLCYMTAYLANSLTNFLPESVVRAWVESVLEQADGQGVANELRRTVATYRGCHLSRRERLMLA